MKRRLAEALLPPLLFLSVAANATAGDAFFRGGIIFHPRTTDLADRWYVSFGSDYAVNLGETAYFGFELQTAVYRDPISAGVTATIVPANGFINAKYKAPTFTARPYIGGGIGLVSDFVFAEGTNDWNRNSAFHFMGGIELGRASAELQIQRNFESGSEVMYSILFGFVWSLAVARPILANP